MKIAVTYDNGHIWEHFGRTEQFKFYNVADGRIEESSVVSTDGASHHALPDFLAENKVEMVICGGIGASMVERLRIFGISVCPGAEGDADQAVSEFLSGTLDVKQNAVHDGCHRH